MQLKKINILLAPAHILTSKSMFDVLVDFFRVEKQSKTGNEGNLAITAHFLGNLN
jgi:hypothetical protein